MAQQSTATDRNHALTYTWRYSRHRSSSINKLILKFEEKKNERRKKKIRQKREREKIIVNPTKIKKKNKDRQTDETNELQQWSAKWSQVFPFSKSKL